MRENIPLVTIGIPTYNRHELLARAISSTLSQDYPLIEVIISDNASTDGTDDLCHRFCKEDDRIKYIKQSFNIGPGANFSEVLSMASGMYFMWLGDDDWIDACYISECVSILSTNTDVALVSGTPLYYRAGNKSHKGKMFDLLDRYWATRVFRYYLNVTDNGMFYGVMHTKQLQKVVVRNVMGSDWHLIANMISMGKSRMLSSVSVHRELGGATASYNDIVRSLGLPKIQGIFPMTTIAIGAWENVMFSGLVYKQYSKIIRIFLSSMLLVSVPFKNIKGNLAWIKRLLNH